MADRGPAFNTSIEGRPLRIAGQQFKKGLGLHASGVVNLTFDKPFATFTGGVGIDDETNSRGSARIELLAGTKVLFRSETLTGMEKLQKFEVNIANLKTLSIRVDGVDNIHFDHVDLVDPKFE